VNTKLRRNIKRVLIRGGLVVVIASMITFVMFVTPVEYRVGVWRNMPQLDHRLLPHISAVFAAAFGAFFGSLSAFYLGRVQQQADRHEKRHAALIAAQYALMSQWNVVEEIRVGHLEQFRNDQERFAKLSLFYFDVTPTFAPFAELTFLLETTEPNLLQEIHLAEQSYQTCVNGLKLRNQELSKYYENPRLQHHLVDFESGRTITSGDRKEAFLLSKATDALYTCVDRTLPRLAGTMDKVERIRMSLFPDKKPLPMVRNSTSADTNE
jgi:hypothetical protein